MATKRKPKTKTITTITIQLTEETGEAAYQATITAGRGELGYVGQFEYFDAQHVTEALEDALAKLAAIERQPPQVEAGPKPSSSPASGEEQTAAAPETPPGDELSGPDDEPPGDADNQTGDLAKDEEQTATEPETSPDDEQPGDTDNQASGPASDEEQTATEPETSPGDEPTNTDNQASDPATDVEDPGQQSLL